MSSAFETSLDGVEKNATELLDVLLLLTFVGVPAERFGKIFCAPGAFVGGLQHDTETLDLKQHRPLATLDKIALFVNRAFTKGQCKYRTAEGWVHVQSLEQRVKIARGAPKQWNSIIG